LPALRRGRSCSSGVDPWPATEESACLGGSPGIPGANITEASAAPPRPCGLFYWTRQ
jgi:hypothetical protein